jgi:hydroxymethylpyrimidine/phosphomethylpyrimidine kinase
MSEILKLRAKLAQKKHELKSNELEAEALQASIRSILDPFEEIISMNTTEALTLMDRLHDTVENMKGIQNIIRKMEKELGE